MNHSDYHVNINRVVFNPLYCVPLIAFYITVTALCWMNPALRRFSYSMLKRDTEERWAIFMNFLAGILKKMLRSPGVQLCPAFHRYKMVSFDWTSSVEKSLRTLQKYAPARLLTRVTAIRSHRNCRPASQTGGTEIVPTPMCVIKLQNMHSITSIKHRNTESTSDREQV